MRSEITEILTAHGKPNSKGEIITDFFGGTAFYSDTTGLVLYDEKMEVYDEGTFSDVSDTLYEIYCYLYDNRYSLVSRENLIEIESVEDISWAVEPVSFSVPCESAKDGLLQLGAFAVGKEPVGENDELRSVIFISPDNTYATLTCYLNGSPEELATAKQDLYKIAYEMTTFADKL